jgi:threonyl-tRNA synthetase
LRAARSYRDLPYRFGEFGLVHRREPSGAVQGLFRLRQFTQDDGHVICRPEQARDEVADFCGSLRRFFADLGFEKVRVPSLLGEGLNQALAVAGGIVRPEFV